MNWNNLKIAWRNVLRSKLFTAMNILGLALGFAGFVLAYLYINRETSYDTWNPNHDHIYLVGAAYQGNKSDVVVAGLASAMEARIPDVVRVGRVNQAPFEVPFTSDRGVFFVKKWLGADLAVAHIFGIELEGGSLDSIPKPQFVLLSAEAGAVLHHDSLFSNGVMMGNKQTGVPLMVDGVARPTPGLTLMDYDCIALANDMSAGFGGVQQMPPVQTYVQLRPGADIDKVTQQINTIYRTEVAKLHGLPDHVVLGTTLYLDPLQNLHLRPQHGSNTGYITMLVIGLLAGVILLLAGINFANLMVAQANKRAKEIGIKKVFGVSRGRLAAQFMGEVLCQCLLAAALAWGLVILCRNGLQQWLAYDLAVFAMDSQIVWQLLLAALLTALVSGFYPATVLSGYHPVNILKGNFQTGHRMTWFRHSLLTLQFVIAIIFITGMFILNRQLQFMREGDKGFDTEQLANIKNLSDFGNPAFPISFETVRNRIKAIPGVEYVTVATSVPGGNAPVSAVFEFQNQQYDIDHIGVGFEYVEAMGMELVSGRLFTLDFPADSINGAIINEAAARALGTDQLLGKAISGCDTDFRIVGIVRDSKMQGFEEAIAPTVYTINNTCGQYKTEILVKLGAGAGQKALATLAKEWPSINKYDGDYFRYEFVDQKYAALFAQQEQLESAVSGFTVLAVIIAMMGLFSMSAYSISIRQKEMSIRKVLGASVGQLFMQLNRPFLRVFLLANLIALPLAYLLVDRWLAPFTYRIVVQWWMFALAGITAMMIALLTVAYQSMRAARANPVDSLRDE